ncbi:HDOD domain-containing protein [Nitratidesulfovibrio sp. SRB-5]|uniref:Metal dependent phosphohydrolase n=1 Tax=Nitratidesulfovibrio vulgaris (strain DSM 19637 / Miyazaki F) TaxID=883 RepID=B8DL23_NITV9|nr:HDOD domain-containing protein [Nitratidesulfovibrio sp. SRB-5]MBZ2172916.1 HDOD domain-containing protein [Nitratidesulfovibrio sp. SRB-5]RXF76045.1 HDOD domain-containing protein [Desulfovibrio sp. DS-1]
MSEDLRTIYKGRLLAVKDLPTLPTALQEVSRLLELPNTTTDQVAKVISFDQVLAAKVLKMVNSPIYGFPGRIGTVKHALVLLGFNVIRGLIISTSVYDDMNRAMRGLWDHSVGCSLACGELARALGMKDPEEYAVAGLLHDLGKVVSALQLPEAKARVDAVVQDQDLPYIDAETQVLGFGHDRINAWLAEHWNLPPAIREGMAFHHKPMSARIYPQMACVVHVGNFMARLFEYGSGGDDNVPQLSPHALKLLGMNQNALEGLLDTLCEKFADAGELGFA